MEKAKILVIDDDADSLASVVAALRRDGYDVVPAADPKEGLARLSTEGADVVLTDLRMPGLTGMEVIRHVVRENPGVPVVVLTAFGTVESAVEAVRAGASDYLMKPVGVPQLRAAVLKALKEREKNRELERKDREIDRLREEAGRAAGGSEIIGSSRAMEEVLRKVRLVAPTRMNVLIQGESGTGKELVAREIHAQSPRGERSFVAVNCAAIPETLLETEMFGHERGAFTGAVATHRGKIEAAEGGTLFLDEIGEISPALQAKLLRAIEQKEITRVGGGQVIRVDVRILAATNLDLKQKVEEKAFREDLFYRLNVFNITVPPLRSRREDIPKLAERFLSDVSRENAIPRKRLSPEAMRLLLSYRWPGNIRELRNAIETSALVSAGDTIGEGDLPPEIAKGFLPPSPSGPIPLPAPKTLQEIEREAIRAALAETGGNKKEAAKILGIGIATLHRKVKTYGITDRLSE